VTLISERREFADFSNLFWFGWLIKFRQLTTKKWQGAKKNRKIGGRQNVGKKGIPFRPVPWKNVNLWPEQAPGQQRITKRQATQITKKRRKNTGRRKIFVRQLIKNFT